MNKPKTVEVPTWLPIGTRMQKIFKKYVTGTKAQAVFKSYVIGTENMWPTHQPLSQGDCGKLLEQNSELLKENEHWKEQIQELALKYTTLLDAYEDAVDYIDRRTEELAVMEKRIERLDRLCTLRF